MESKLFSGLFWILQIMSRFRVGSVSGHPSAIPVPWSGYNWSPGFLPMSTRRDTSLGHNTVSLCPPERRLGPYSSQKGGQDHVRLSSLWKSRAKSKADQRLLMFTSYPSSFFCIMKHWWWFSHYFSPFRAGTRVFKIHEWVGALSAAAALFAPQTKARWLSVTTHAYNI